STRGELLRRLGRDDEARAAYQRALELATSTPERRFLPPRRGQPSASPRPPSGPGPPPPTPGPPPPRPRPPPALSRPPTPPHPHHPAQAQALALAGLSPGRALVRRPNKGRPARKETGR